jgi:hypothetical protein
MRKRLDGKPTRRLVNGTRPVPEPFRVDPEFQALIPPPSPAEDAALEQALLAEKECRDALVVWAEESLLLDGHRRLAICRRHSLFFQVHPLSLPSRAAAKEYICNQQRWRNNLTPLGASYVRGEHYLVRRCQGQRRDLTSCQNGGTLWTADVLAAEYGVAARTISRDASFALAVRRVVATCGEVARLNILGHSPSLRRPDVLALARLRPEDMPARYEELCGRGRRRQGAADAAGWLRVPRDPAALAWALVQHLGPEQALAAWQHLAAVLRSQGVILELPRALPDVPPEASAEATD